MTNDELVRLKALCAAATPEITLPVGYNPDGTPASLFYDAARTALPLLIAEIERMRPAFEAACEYRLKADEMRAAPINTGEVFDLGPLYEARSALFAAVDAARAKEST